MSLRTSNELEPTTLDEAATWYGRLQAQPALRASQEFHDWLATPGAAESLGRVTDTWNALGPLADAPEIVELRQQSQKRMRGKRRGMAWLAAGLAASLILAASLWIVGRYAPAPQTYRTALLERRAVRLADGSKLTLDSDTQVQVRLTPGRRRIDLLRGQAKFEVAHDTARPFTVTAGDRNVLATGTLFDVEVLPGETVVTLLGGHVTVRPIKAAAADSVMLQPGERLVAPTGRPGRVSHVDIAAASAWEEGKLLFDDTPLEEVIARINRYSPRRWSVDPTLRSLRISGLFDAGDVDAFLDALSSYFSVTVSVGPDQTIILQRALSPEAPKKIASSK